MLRSEKKTFVSELEKIYQDSSSVIITHYHGLTVLQITNLRKALGENGASFKIVKNTLSKIAATNVKLTHNPEAFFGPTAIAYSKDPVAAAKGVVDFAKANDNLKVIGGIVNDKILNVVEVQQLAKLPSLDQLRGKIVGILQAPATNLARIIQAPAGSLARVIQAYSEKNN